MANHSFNRAFNAVFGKVVKAASVVVDLMTKPLPIFCYGLQVCLISNR